MSSAPTTGTPCVSCWNRAWVIPSASVSVFFTASSTPGSRIRKSARWSARMPIVVPTGSAPRASSGIPTRDADRWSGVWSVSCSSQRHSLPLVASSRSNAVRWATVTSSVGTGSARSESLQPRCSDHDEGGKDELLHAASGVLRRKLRATARISQRRRILPQITGSRPRDVAESVGTRSRHRSPRAAPDGAKIHVVECALRSVTEHRRELGREDPVVPRRAK